MPRLIVVQGTRHEAFELADGETVIGAASGTGVTLAGDPEVSRRHARIERQKGKTFIEDMGSRNGTFVNEVRVGEKAELRSGDRLRIGQTVVFYLSEDPAESGAKGGSKTKQSASGRLIKEKKRDRLTNLLILQEINKALNSETDLGRLLELIMDTAIHLISAERGFLVLVNDDRLEFVVARNVDYDVVRSPAFKVSNSVIRRVAKSGEPLLTSNAQADLADVKSVVSLDLRSLLCVPLKVKSRTIGTLYLDSRARTTEFDQDSKDLLCAFSDQAAIAIENARLLREAKEKEAILSELRVAHRIQRALLPENEPNVAGLELKASMATAKEVGGDYYDYIASRRGDLVVAIGDVSGKGVPAGLIMVMARSTLRSLAQAQVEVDPRAIAIEANRILKQDLKPGMFMSLLLARWDPRGVFRLAGCGHERPLVYRARAKRVEAIELGGLVLGVVPDNSQHVGQAEVALEPGDQLLLYTDGVTEAMDPDKKQFGLDRLQEFLAANGHLAPAELIAMLQQDIARHVQGADPHDDITLIALRRKS